MIKKIRSLALLIAVTAPSITMAAAEVDSDVAELYKEVGKWYNGLLLPIGAVLAGIMIIYGGILYSVSGGEPGKIQKGKDYIIGAISGLALLLGVWLIVRSIVS